MDAPFDTYLERGARCRLRCTPRQKRRGERNARLTHTRETQALTTSLLFSLSSEEVSVVCSRPLFPPDVPLAVICGEMLKMVNARQSAVGEGLCTCSLRTPFLQEETSEKRPRALRGRDCVQRSGQCTSRIYHEDGKPPHHDGGFSPLVMSFGLPQLCRVGVDILPVIVSPYKLCSFQLGRFHGRVWKYLVLVLLVIAVHSGRFQPSSNALLPADGRALQGEGGGLLQSESLRDGSGLVMLACVGYRWHSTQTQINMSHKQT